MRYEKVYASVLTVAALGVRFYLSTLYYLNPDECMHLNAGSAAQWSLHHHPPLLFWWLWLATLVSDQIWWVRLLPTVCGGLVPLAMGIWLRRFLRPVTAWGLATVVAISPILTLLSFQLRGYSMAMLGTLLALYALEEAFEQRSRRWLGVHFAFLFMALLAEFGAAFVVFAAGVYGLVRLWREPESRRLLPVWLAGQVAAAGTYVALYFVVIRPVAERMAGEPLIALYLRAAFPVAGQNPLVFVWIGVLKQFAYVAGGVPAGALALGLALMGAIFWVRGRDWRLLLVAGMYMTAAGAFLRFFPFGRSRHSVLVGIVSLAALGAGADWLAWWKPKAGTAAVALLLVLGLAFPMPDINNIPLADWEEGKLKRALAQTMATVPTGELLLTDEETSHVLRANYMPREERQEYAAGRTELPPMAGHPILRTREFDWSSVPTETIAAMLRRTKGRKWILDTGFAVGTVGKRARELGITLVIDEPGVLFLGRAE